MKRMKRIMALMLAAIMMMAMSVTAFAAEGAGTHTLTVNAKGGQDLKGQTINLYKLFDVTESGTTESKNYAYTVNTATGYKDAIKSALGTSFTGTTDEEYACSQSGWQKNCNVRRNTGMVQMMYIITLCQIAVEIVIIILHLHRLMKIIFQSKVIFMFMERQALEH